MLILLDCEDDCPAELGPELLRRAIAIHRDVPYFVALAYREFETWFIAAAESLRGREGLIPSFKVIDPRGNEVMRVLRLNGQANYGA